MNNTVLLPARAPSPAVSQQHPIVKPRSQPSPPAKPTSLANPNDVRYLPTISQTVLSRVGETKPAFLPFCTLGTKKEEEEPWLFTPSLSSPCFPSTSRPNEVAVVSIFPHNSPWYLMNEIMGELGTASRGVYRGAGLRCRQLCFVLDSDYY